MHEIKDAILEAQSTLLVLPDDAKDKDYLASLQLQKLAPEKVHIVAPEAREQFWTDVFHAEPIKKEFTININTAISPIEELRYERTDGLVTIYLSHRNKFRQEALSFAELLPPADLIVTIGFPSRDAAERAIEHLPRKGAARHIYLSENGSEEKLAREAAGLLGRLMVRSRQDPAGDALWSFVTREDFEKSGATPDLLPSLVDRFASITAIPHMALVFWQFGEDGTHGFIWSHDNALLDTIAGRIGGEHAHHSYVGLPIYANFIEAETETRKLLREAGLR